MANSDRGTEKVLDGKSRPRQRQASPRSLTKDKARIFFEALAASCNVKLAAKKAEVSASAIYARRACDASFRAHWERALAMGYAQLEMMMLERALHGVEKIVVKAGEPVAMREYSDRVALALLRMHKDSAAQADAEIDATEAGEVAARIVERLRRLRTRDEAAVLETKAASAHLQLIGWALIAARGG